MVRINTGIFWISEPKCMGMGEFNSDDHYTYYCGQESLTRHRVALMRAIKESEMQYLDAVSKMKEWSPFPRQTFNTTVIQVYAPTTNAEEVQLEWLYKELPDFLKLTPKKDVLFILGDGSTNVGSEEIPRVTGKFGLEVQNAAGQRLTEFCQENTLVIANTFFQKHKRWIYIWTSADCQYQNQTDCIFCSRR